ncbi:MAG: DotA/TraY family protein [Alphaproteobacteria bacterium]|nr:DotA/TraY family protein [Alphaproteobacteria bacterium]
MSTLRGKVLKYTLLPGFAPRLFEIFTAGFSHTAYLIAIIYQALRLLPISHPYLKPQNIGCYGIRHVIAEAANNLVMSRKNIDQIIIFFMILIGFVLLLVQFALLLATMFSQQAFAISPEDVLKVTSSFAPQSNHPAQDLAFIILDRVFGTQGIFNSCISQIGVDCLGGTKDLPVSTPNAYPLPMHIALHTLLRFYSLGIFIVSVFIILYFVVAMVSETAATGIPFGQRANKVWVPIRLIVFLALLVPLNIGSKNEGLNAAQIITFWVAKTGSNFATNAWGQFNQTLEASATGNMSLLGDPNTLIATPNIPEITILTQFMFIANTCKILEEYAYTHESNLPTSRLEGIRAYIVRKERERPLVINNDNMLKFSSTSFSDALKFSNNDNIIIRFGAFDPNNETYKTHEGSVFPYCGEIRLSIINTDRASIAGAAHSGSYAIQELYYNLLQRMWLNPQSTEYATCVVAAFYGGAGHLSCSFIVDDDFRALQIDEYTSYLRTNLPNLIQQEIDNGVWNISDSIRSKGWAGAALWYNRIAQMNGDIGAAILNSPKPYRYPYVLETITSQRRMISADITATSIFDPILASGENVNFPRNLDSEIAPAMRNAYLVWDVAHEQKISHGVVIDAINFIFGTNGLFSIRNNSDIHPLAQLSSLGRSMMEASVRNLGFGFMGSLLARADMDTSVKKKLKAHSNFLKTLGTTSLAMSFILSYILPILPFIYFLFAVSGWVKSIFEAIVAMPLWALAHIIRIDGEGLPGPAATNGYFLLLEIFLRPILMLVGLLASIALFSAMVNVLNDVFDLVVSNAGGFDMESARAGNNFQEETNFFRAPIDMFFYTAMYVIICYMIGLSSFKLIDAIPNNILRWAGVTISTFQEEAGDPGSEVSRKVYSGVTIGTGQIEGGALALM